MLLLSFDRLSIFNEGPTPLAFQIQWRTRMTTAKLLSAALIAVAALATPAMAREAHVTSRHHANVTTTSSATDVDGRGCIPAPAVGAFATQPWDNGPPCEPGSFN
jgi:hypothetical protein